jgi:hypothetical protein
MALSWGARRQLMIIGTFVAIIVVIALAIIIPKLNTKPTCSDGKQNGTEQGVDCGGACSKLCAFQTTDVVVKWSRVFSVTNTVASVVAYIQNPNITAAARNVPYEFKIYDADHQFIADRSGVAYIAPNGSSAIFEGGIQVGSRIPKYAEFHFTADPLWVSLDPRVSSIAVVPTNQVLENAGTKPKITGTISNISDRYGVRNISVVAVAYNTEDNAVGASQTFVAGLDPKGTSEVYFTWPNPFPDAVTRIELIPRYDVFSLSFK